MLLTGPKSRCAACRKDQLAVATIGALGAATCGQYFLRARIQRGAFFANCGRHRLNRQRNAFGHAFHEKPRETCVLMTEVSAFLGAQPRAVPPRDVSTSRGGISTTFQSCQSLTMCAVSVAIRPSFGECRLETWARTYNKQDRRVAETQVGPYWVFDGLPWASRRSLQDTRRSS